MGTKIDPVRLTVFHELFASIAEEMGEVLRGTAISVNIRERQDYSCALFDSHARLVSQAAHIPVHLGSASLSVQSVCERVRDLEDGDCVLLNDPYAGGTHLPDLTLVTPVFAQGKSGTSKRRDAWFLVTRAHHSDVGGAKPGSMAPAEDLLAEGLRIPPVRIVKGGKTVEDVLALVLANTRSPWARKGDLRAQIQANELGKRRLLELWKQHGRKTCLDAAIALMAYTGRLVRRRLSQLRPGTYLAKEYLEGDGVDEGPVELQLELRVAKGGKLLFDFSNSADQVPGCLNANKAVTCAAVLYCIRCLCVRELPTNAGLLESVSLKTREASILDPRFPAACAGGNVETSQRLVDLCLAALGQAGASMPAQSAGTMNNLSLGGRTAEGAFAFYETIGGGAGASEEAAGASGIQTHMTNTRNTPVEEIELTMPLFVERYSLRRGSGGKGRHAGGCGIVKELRATQRLSGSLLSERRRLRPRGAAGGGDGAPGGQCLLRRGRKEKLAAKCSFVLEEGTVLRVETPGGGGYGGEA